MTTIDVFDLGVNNDFRKYRKVNNFSKGLAVGLGDDEVKEAMVSVSEDGKVYDSTKFIKMYSEGLVAMGKLVTGGKLMDYVFDRMLAEGNIVELKAVAVLVKCGYSESSRTVYYRMLKELRDVGILKKISSKRYMVNPNMFYYGNRIKDMGEAVREYFKRKAQL